MSEPAKPKVARTGGMEEKKLSPLTRGTILMALMFVVGLGWVFMQSKKAKYTPTDGSRQETVKNMMPLINGNCLTGKARQAQLDKLIRPLTYEPTSRQIPAEQLAINPFEDYLYRQAELIKANAPKETPEQIRQRKLAEKKKIEKIKKQQTPPPPTKDLEIQSIISGPRPSVMIKNKIVYEGQLIGGWRVMKILPNKVIIKWRDQTQVLRMKKK